MSLELARRIAFTVGALLVYRIGSYIPLPGIDLAAWVQIAGRHSGDAFGLLDISSAGAARRLAIFALGILPYVSAAVILQLASIFSARFRNLSTQGYNGRRRTVVYTRVLTLVLAAAQAYALAEALDGMPSIVSDPGISFRLTTVVTLAGGALFVAWLADQITARGIGNGIALILALGFFIEVPELVASAADYLARGLISPDRMLVAVIIAVAVTALVAFIEGARRRINVDYPGRTILGRVIESQSSPLLLKINSAGLIPAVIGAWLIYLLAFVLSLTLAPGWRSAIFNQLHHGRPLYMALLALVIFGMALYYTAFLLDPEKVSEALKRHGGVLRGVAPGEATADYIDYVLTRVTLIGAVYLAAIYIIPELLVGYFQIPVFMGGASLLVVVCTMLDIEMQVKQEALLQRGGVRR